MHRARLPHAHAHARALGAVVAAVAVVGGAGCDTQRPLNSSIVGLTLDYVKSGAELTSSFLSRADE